MPILHINSSRKRGVRVRGRAKVKLRRAKHRRNPTRKIGEGGRTRKTRMTRKVRRSRKPKRSIMARRRRKKSHARKARRSPRRRRHGGKKRVVRRRRKRRAKRSAPKRRRRRRARKAAPKRRRRRRARKSTRRRRRRARKSHRRRRRRKSRRSRRSRRTRRSRARVMYGPTGPAYTAGGTRIGYARNPRRRRRRRSSSRRYSHRKRRKSGRTRRRYGGGSYRKNPGRMLIDLAKKAAPVLIGFYGARLFAAKVGPMIPGVSSLGTFAGPALAIGTVVGLNFATKKIGALAKHRETLLLGAGLALLDTLVQSFAPASIKAMIGVGDVYDRALGEYVGVGDYVEMGSIPINDRITMSDYISVGGDGVEQELGLDQELGALEELGDAGDLNPAIGGVARSSMMAAVGRQRFLAPVPARSFTSEIAGAGTQYDNAADVGQGIFRGGF